MAHKVTSLGLLAAIAMIIGYLESQLPFSLIIPGMKLGLCNLVIVYVIYRYSIKEALMVSLVRILVLGFLFGNMMSIAFSAGGSIVSILSMGLLKKTDKFSVCGVSVFGGCAHNIGQLIVALAVIPLRAVLAYMPFLTLAGSVTGMFIGIISMIMIARLDAIKAGR